MRPPPTLGTTILLITLPSVLADVLFTSPAPGASIAGGTTFTVAWKESGTAPAIVDLASFDLFLYSGSNAAPQQLYGFPLTVKTFAAGTSVTVNVPVGTGGTGTNAYFIGMQSTAVAGGTITNFSPRFTLTSMTGTFPAAVVASNKNIVGTSSPPAIKALAGAVVPPGGGVIDAGAWATPYNEQVGPVRYAPMQPVPPTKITATNTKPLWPTSDVPIATTFLPVLGSELYTTQTQPQTFSAASHANTAAPQSRPVDDMQKFLNRWKD